MDKIIVSLIASEMPGEKSLQTGTNEQQPLRWHAIGQRLAPAVSLRSNQIIFLFFSLALVFPGCVVHILISAVFRWINYYWCFQFWKGHEIHECLVTCFCSLVLFLFVFWMQAHTRAGQRGATENARCMCIATWLAGNVDRTGIIRENSSFTSEPNACSSLRYNNTSFFLEIQKHYSFSVEQTIRVLVYNRMHWFWSVLCYCYHRSTANAEFFIGWQKGGMAILLLSIMRVLTMRCCENISEFQHILIHWWNEHIFRS